MAGGSKRITDIDHEDFIRYVIRRHTTTSFIHWLIGLMYLHVPTCTYMSLLVLTCTYRSIDFLKGWPTHLLDVNPKLFVFTYYP